MLPDRVVVGLISGEFGDGFGAIAGFVELGDGDGLGEGDEVVFDISIFDPEI